MKRGGVLPPLEEVMLDRDNRDDERQLRRASELAKQEMDSSSRVQTLDGEGRARATGKRKEAIARVWIRPGQGDVTVNNRPLGSYFSVLENREQARGPPPAAAALLHAPAAVLRFVTGPRHRGPGAQVLSPFVVSGTLGMFDTHSTVQGGGSTGQAQALRQGVAKALQAYDPELRTPLRAFGFITRDSRVVERKKPGRAKARKSFQWVRATRLQSPCCPARPPAFRPGRLARSLPTRVSLSG